MRNRNILTTLCFVLASSACSGQKSFSLQEAIVYGVEHSADVRLKQLDVADADGRLLEYKSIGIPKLYAEVDYAYYFDIPTQLLPDFLSPAVYGILAEEGLVDPREVPAAGTTPVQFGKEHNVNASVDLNFQIFDFAWIQGLKAQKLFRDLVQKDVRATEYEIRSAITKAYLAVLINKKNYELLDNNIRNLRRLLDETEAIYENGFAEKLDVDRLELSLHNLETDRQNVERMTTLTRNLLKFQMGYPMDQEIVLTGDFDVLTSQIAVDQIDLNADVDYNERPEYASILLTEELNEVNMRVIRAGYLPSLHGRASHAQVLQRNKLFDSGDSPWFPTTIAGITLSVPIFDGLERKAKLERARINHEKVIVRREEFERSVDLEVMNARLRLINARESAESRREAMQLAQTIYDTTQIKYREGVGSSVELTQAEADLYTSQTNYINALYDLIVARTDLDIALGNL